MPALAYPRRTRVRNRPRRRAHHRIGLWAETLEARRLLASTPISVASGLIAASGLPLPGLATGSGFSATAQSPSTASVTVAPASVLVSPTTTASMVPTANGPSTTLSPLMDDSETAVATASEVARPTPGRSDRISVVLPAPDAVPIPELRSSDPIEVIPGPEILGPPAPAPLPAPAQAPAEPARAVELAPAPVARAVPEEANEPITFEAWDASLGIIAADLADEAPASTSPTHQTEAVVAAGAMLAAWTGWKYGPRSKGRSRRRPLAILAVEAGPGR